MKTDQRISRLAGAAWLVIIAAGIYAEVFVRSALSVPGDAAATAANIAAADTLFRIGIAGDVVMLLADVVVAGLLYILLRPINRGLALLAAFFRLVQASVLGANLSNLTDVLRVLGGSETLQAFGADQLHALALTYLGAHATGYDLGLFFFAFALFILGYLFFKSGYVPRVLSVLLSLSGLVYLAGSLITVLAPAYGSSLEPVYLLPFVSELSLALWLLVRGVNVERWEELARPLRKSRTEEVTT